MSKSVTFVFGPPEFTKAQLRILETELMDRLKEWDTDVVVLPHGSAVSGQPLVK